MDENDEQLLDFDKPEIDWRPERAAAALTGPYADIYRNHLTVARWADGYAERYQASNMAAASPEHRDGFVEGVLWMAAFLRQGDLLPDGDLLQQDDPGLPDRDSTPDS
ncbi:hypothetical protein [Streptomyces scabiei]|uniref:hypothetical protein n=1 Tax=Streptomyces scabiei TaxID=1930 RepID=UPI001B338C75|nr:hypothetical protein [Streptomyces sp. LBUM 1488]MBP5897951.1 hypothetical protein [Streptomyces sp. LBUM 1488]